MFCVILLYKIIFWQSFIEYCVTASFIYDIRELFKKNIIFNTEHTNLYYAQEKIYKKLDYLIIFAATLVEIYKVIHCAQFISK